MKVLGIIGKVIVAIWNFLTVLTKISLIATFAILILTILMPDNASKAIEIVKGFIP
jgi:hypothetical protein